MFRHVWAKVQKTSLTALVPALSFVAVPPATASSLPGIEIDYSLPGTLVNVGRGRHLHLLCAGTGSPTVVLIPGLGDSTIVWNQVQPTVARRTRVCAWDRAGFGFSDPSPHEQTAVERTKDLERALRGARVAGPYVVVGHSLGSYETFVFADRNRRNLAGLVLVDPSLPDQLGRFRRAGPDYAAYSVKGFATAVEGVERCLSAIREHRIKPGDPDPDGCFAYPDYYPGKLKRRLETLDSDYRRVATQLNYDLHNANSADGRSPALLNPRRNYGSIPLIVLSAGNKLSPPKEAGAAIAEQAPKVQAEWWKAHDEFAALSTRGVHHIVEGAQHTIQQTKPEAVVSAINQVVTAARKGPRSHKR